MYIRPISDIHNEFSVYNLPVTEFDSKAVLVMAGDIAVADAPSSLYRFLDSVTERFTDILYIPGNHEYYHGSLRRVDDKLAEVCSSYMNVHYMNQQSMKIADVRFIGATLWTDYNRGDPMVQMHCSEVMNDFVKIRTGIPGKPYQRRITPSDIISIHMEHKRFIESELKKGHAAGEKMVVFTHHAPSFISRPPQEEMKFKYSLTDYAYYNVGMEDMISKYMPIVWVHGHSHYPVDTMFDYTRIVANTRGYANHPDKAERSDFNPSLVIEL